MKADASRAPVPAAHRRAFLLRRLHSLSGVFPVGVFLVMHLWTNAKGLGGQAAFDRAVQDIHHLPFLPAIEVVGIFLPLAFHAFYGVKLALSARPNVASYPFARNWLYLVQRATGLLAFAFICWHLWEFRIQKLVGAMSPEAFYPTLSMRLSSTISGVPVLAIVYLAGIAASVIHFANGLVTFAFSWGLCVTRASQRTFAWTFAVLGLIVFAFGANTTLYFATGARLFGLAEGSDSSVPGSRCSVVDPPTALPPSAAKGAEK
ncbi:MAG TPA: succinate dehydrogenase [Polyangiaceae bacterium]|nr:succinate dehydrogenase [Polyangiaceae bacterium]